MGILMLIAIILLITAFANMGQAQTTAGEIFNIAAMLIIVAGLLCAIAAIWA